MPTIRLEHVTKSFRNSEHKGAAVSDVELTISQGDFIFLVGSRGAGKSTLLNLISGNLYPDQGKIYLDDVPVGRMGMQRSRLRSLVSALVRERTVRWNLTPHSPAAWLENRLGGEGDALVKKALGLVGMSGVEERYPREFSLGDCRRIEVARAILASPALLILDGITDKLDDDTTWDLLHLLTELNTRGTTVLMVTNAARFINIMRRRVITMADGKIVGDVAKGRYDTVLTRTRPR